MQNVIRFTFIFLALTTLCDCSSHPRTKWTDPSMRVMVDPYSLSASDYIRIVNALQQSGKWFVVDRRDGLRAIIKEQNMLHRTHVDRFKDEEKYAMWGRLFGVGAVVTGHVQCAVQKGFFSDSTRCVQNLAIVSANSGQVITTSENESSDAEMSYDGDIRIASDWTDAVEKLNNAFPKEFHEEKYDTNMNLFRQEAREEAVRQKEMVLQKGGPLESE